jgi:4-amino-4-deoxy-L-arabinose transferase-like glycosyltransferase
MLNRSIVSEHERAAMDLLDTRRPRLLLLAFCLLVWLPGFFTLPPTDRDESRFAQASKQMIETGDYVRIMNGNVPRNLKPIGIYWLQVPFAKAARALHVATANPIWPYRLPSLAGGIVAVLATFEIGLAMADRRKALLAAGMLASCVILTVESHIAKTDAALLGATTVAMAVLARAYRGLPVGRGQAALFWVAMGVGILLKGPITPMVAGFTCITLAAVDRRAAWLRVLRPASGVALLAVIVLPWFIAIAFATHGAFFGDAVGGDLGHKLSGGDDAHGAPPGTHLVLLLLLAFPATLPVLRSLPGWWHERRDPAFRFLLAWIIPAWVVFEAVPTKLPHYTLPLYPAIFLLAALLWDRVPAGRWGRTIAPALSVLVACVLGVAAAALAIAAGAPLLGIPALLAVGLLGWLALQPGRPGLALAAMPLFTVSLLGFELPEARPLWIAPQVEHALVAAGLAGQPLVSAGFAEPSLMFLAGTRTIFAPNGAAAAEALLDGRASAASVARPDMASFLDEAARIGLGFHAFGTASGVNYSRGRKTELTLFAPDGVVRQASAAPPNGRR